MAPEQTTSVPSAERRRSGDEDLRLKWESGRWVLRERTRRG
ncbi:MAG: hypothetical protein XU14_C0040G0017 [Armatimonadetes bacterium CSP1-3]|nr:MAG: hypothetical protein XU14_C0040G0017 [Armatimonadetes bacterium CSP1-3]